MAVATFEATEAAASVVFRPLASVKTIVSTSLILNMSLDHESRFIAVTHNRNCNRLKPVSHMRQSCRARLSRATRGRPSKLQV